MDAKVKDKIKNISLMLVMTAPGDDAGVKMILEFCEELRGLVSHDPECKRLLEAIDYVNQHESSDSIVALLNDFANAANQFCDGAASAVFPHEKAVSDSKQPLKTAETQNGSATAIDASLLGEYAESHLPMLEEFESWVMKFKKDSSAELSAEIKRYIHTLKGDSGAVGFFQVESVCHQIEDLIDQHGLARLCDGLLQFKEWVALFIRSALDGKSCSQSADHILDSIKKELRPASPPAPASQPKRVAASHFAALPASYTLSGEKEILIEFAAEAEEHLNNVEVAILDADGHYTKDAIDTIFRGVHSIKGGSAYFTIQEMTHCSHILENMLVQVRDGKRQLDDNLSRMLFTYIDLQKNVLGRAKEAVSVDGVVETSPRSQQLLRELHALSEGKVEESPSSVASVPEPTTDIASGGESESRGEKINVKSFVKVETARLDHLIDSIGEMVIYSSMLIRHCRELLPNHTEVMNTSHRVEKFSRDLQDIGMSMRLVPIKGLFQKMSRLVWDTSKKLGKEVTFSMDGEDTELDRNLIDKLADPLMHMVRNSLDHGLETPEERIKAGKSRGGNVKLSAFHSGGNIHICIEDDGRGINPEKIFAKAVEKGLVSAGDKLSDSEIFHLIFAPGFSTAAVVTDISGRGVGMDVVRKNVESLRGRIHIESEVGKGSRFIMELPLTLAIIDGIQIGVGQEHFIIPSLSIVEFVRPLKDMLTGAFDVGETLHFRGKYLPIFRLADLYHIEPTYSDPEDATLVVVECHDQLVAIMVDEILGECSTVIKSLGPVFEQTRGLAGCAIMPRGEVALILDVRSLIELARENSKGPNRGVRNKQSEKIEVNAEAATLH